ncbi:MAG: serine/threonine-protein phosphatase [Planctomycetes bacterium]|nr:serine/threonine-protein phosphatase [Planctomycetota bacterium]
MSTAPSELDAARLDLLRRRLTFLWAMLGVLTVLLAVLPVWVAWNVQHRELRRPELFATIVNIAMGCWLMIVQRVRGGRFGRLDLKGLIRRATMVMLASVMTQTLGAQIVAGAITVILRRWGVIGENANIGPMFPMIAYLALVHTAVSVVIPWTILEAARPILIVLAFTAVGEMFLFGNDSGNFRLLGFLLPVLAGVPGMLIAALRYGKLRDWVQIRRLTTRQEEIDRELGVARRIHERLFPAPGDYHGVRVVYAYEPMRQIGGDYLHVASDPQSGATIVVVDVTGHGIGSALAVNRLHGEIKRIGAARGGNPASLLQALNEYIGATLSDEMVFATALAVRVCPRERKVEWCNAGHPPAMLVRRDGRVQRLDTSAMMLGVGEWDGTLESAALEPGDVIVLYTDGVIEAADTSGAQFGIDAVETTLAPKATTGAASMVEVLHAAVRQHRHGPAGDDLLIVGIE